MIQPRDVAARVRQCPACGCDHYTCEMAPGLPLQIKAIRCDQCGADILRAYRAAAPAFFGLTMGQLDRLAMASGIVVVVLAAIWMLLR